MAFDHPAIVEVQPDGFGLGDEITDREHQAFVDHDRIAGAFGAERLRAERVGGNDRVQAHDRGQGVIKIILVIFGARLEGERHFPFGQRRHLFLLLCRRLEAPTKLLLRVASWPQH